MDIAELSGQVDRLVEQHADLIRDRGLEASAGLHEGAIRIYLYKPTGYST